MLRAETEAALACIAEADPLRPHVLIYVAANETLHVSPTEPKRALDLLRLAAAMPPDVVADAWGQFDKATRNGERMEPWVRLLQRAVDSVTGNARERASRSLFTAAGAAGAGGAAGMDDWEVVSWLAIIEP